MLPNRTFVEYFPLGKKEPKKEKGIGPENKTMEVFQSLPHGGNIRRNQREPSQTRRG